MTTRRSFITGLMATAATGAARACPAQPATVFCGVDQAAPGADLSPWFLQPMGRGLPSRVLHQRIHYSELPGLGLDLKSEPDFTAEVIRYRLTVALPPLHGMGGA